MAEQERTFLRFLLEANPRQVKLLLAHSTTRQIQALGEVAYNSLYASLEPSLLKDLKRYRHLLRELANSGNSVSRRRKYVVRKSKAVVEILRLVEGLLP